MKSEARQPPIPASCGEIQPVGRNEVRILVAILVGAALVRLPGMFTSLWFDEAMYSRAYFDDSARRSWLLWKDVHPPVYPLLLWLWSSLFGNHEAVLRLPSYFSGLGSLVVTWALARRCFGVGTALLATAFLAFSPAHIWHSAESKTNMLALFLSVLALWLAVRAADAPRGRWRWPAMFAALLLALGTHSHALATAGTIFAWLGWRSLRERRLRFAAAATGATILVVWLPLFAWKVHLQGATLARSYLRAFDLGEVYKLLLVWFPHGNTIRRLLLSRPLGEVLRQPWPYFLLDGLCALAFLVGLGAAARGAWPKTDREQGQPEPWASRLLLLWLLPPLLAAGLASLVIHHFYIERNFLQLLPAYALLLALGAMRLRWRWVRLAAGATLLGLAFAGTTALLVFRQNTWSVNVSKPDWHSAAAWLLAEGTTNGKLVVATTSLGLEAEFYLRAPEHDGRSITVIDYCRYSVSPRFLARQTGGSFWLERNLTVDQCWSRAHHQILRDTGMVLRRERSFPGLILEEFRVR